MKISYRQAQPQEAPQVAELIMQAMNYECCQNFAGPEHTVDDFRRVMTRLVAQRGTQYSYENTIVAVAEDGTVAGCCVTYDGGELLRLREAFIREARENFGIDYSQMDEETQAGELYIDSLAVSSEYRGQGIATELLRRAILRAKGLSLPAVGLLVDKGNPKAERLYQRVGFQYQNDASWGGHPMKHLQITTNLS